MNTFGLNRPVYAFGLGARIAAGWREIVRFALAIRRLWSTSVER